ncbi:MAG: Aldose 1-epimerase [Paenibacillus sp.]|nr:Aldose 1-epimerase [Paenibacillus sp.]
MIPATHTVRETKWRGYNAVEAENDALKVTVVPGLGSRIVSLYSKKKQLELLRVPTSVEAYEQAPMLYGVPILFPPNRIADGSFFFHGRIYQFDQNDIDTGSHSHGLVHDKEWKQVDLYTTDVASVIITEFNSVHDPEVMKQLPHPFRLVMKLSLEAGKVTQKIEVHNESNDEFPWGIGYHTTFQFPFGAASTKEGCKLHAPVGRRWELTERFLPTGNMITDSRSQLLNAGMIIKGVKLDDLFETNRGLVNEAIMTDRDAGLQVRYTADSSFGHWVLHNGDGDGNYVCPEPYTCVTNAFNLALPPDQTGMNTIQPGECQTVTCAFQVEYLIEVDY